MARPDLSERELQVLKYMALGRSNKEIGQVLYISENTVKGHVKSILTKLSGLVSHEGWLLYATVERS
jgi:two-component system NarL family response regulator